MPTATKKAPAPASAAPDGKVEALAAEAVPAQRPDGAPDLWPFLSLPRRQRAKMLATLGNLTSRQAALDRLADADGEMDLADAAQAYELLADAEDMLAVAAVDPAAYGDWAAKATDADLTRLLAWYMERFQVGEAPASPS